MRDPPCFTAPVAAPLRSTGGRGGGRVTLALAGPSPAGVIACDGAAGGDVSERGHQGGGGAGSIVQYVATGVLSGAGELGQSAGAAATALGGTFNNGTGGGGGGEASTSGCPVGGVGPAHPSTTPTPPCCVAGGREASAPPRSTAKPASPAASASPTR
ncbi:MAG: hypothetical protein R3F39_14905 [Myxococcota bacterium]